jgi:RNA polymerase sigma factor (sigma-70 family)
MTAVPVTYSSALALTGWHVAGSDCAARWSARSDQTPPACGQGGAVAESTARSFSRDDTDADLVVRIAEGDHEALEQLYRRYRARLLAYLTPLTPDGATAEEVLQDTLLAIWRGAHSFQGRSTVKTWMYAIARRQTMSRLRRRSLTMVELDEQGAFHDRSLGPEDQALLALERQQLAALLGRLSRHHREALVLFFIDDLSYAEMAQVLQVAVGTVKSRLSNARRALARLAAVERPGR